MNAITRSVAAIVSTRSIRIADRPVKRPCCILAWTVVGVRGEQRKMNEANSLTGAHMLVKGAEDKFTSPLLRFPRAPFVHTTYFWLGDVGTGQTILRWFTLLSVGRLSSETKGNYLNNHSSLFPRSYFFISTRTTGQITITGFRFLLSQLLRKIHTSERNCYPNEWIWWYANVNKSNYQWIYSCQFI